MTQMTAISKLMTVKRTGERAERGNRMRRIGRRLKEERDAEFQNYELNRKEGKEKVKERLHEREV